MASQLIWGLQHLKRELADSQQEEFSLLEEKLLDVLHKMHLYPSQTDLKSQCNNLLKQCENLATTYTTYTMDDLCKGNAIDYYRPRSATSISSYAVLEQRPARTDYPDVKIKLLTRQVPISYCYQKSANPQDFPLISLTIDTTHFQDPFHATVDVSLQKYGSSAPHHHIFPPGEIKTYDFLPTITREQAQQITTKCPATIQIVIQSLQPSVPPWKDSRQVFLFSYNTALLWKYNWNRKLIDCINHLASWVTPHALSIRQLLGKAVTYHPDQAFSGYGGQSSSKARQKQEAHKVAQAIFAVLAQETGIRYINSPMVHLSESEPDMQVLQWIRLPEESLLTKSANCLDGSVLFASLLELAMIRPLLLLRPGHALVGWWTTTRGDEPEFLETTMIAQGDFTKAWKAGQAQYLEACAKGVFGKRPTCLDTEDYAPIIDIAECRTQDILSL